MVRSRAISNSKYGVGLLYPTGGGQELQSPCILHAKILSSARFQPGMLANSAFKTTLIQIIDTVLSKFAARPVSQAGLPLEATSPNAEALSWSSCP